MELNKREREGDMERRGEERGGKEGTREERSGEERRGEERRGEERRLTCWAFERSANLRGGSQKEARAAFVGLLQVGLIDFKKRSPHHCQHNGFRGRKPSTACKMHRGSGA